jgi:hypothetical protein
MKMLIMLLSGLATKIGFSPSRHMRTTGNELEPGSNINESHKDSSGFGEYNAVTAGFRFCRSKEAVISG